MGVATYQPQTPHHPIRMSNRSFNPLALWGRKKVERAASKTSSMVINATQELQMGVDWSAATAICDHLRQEPEHAPEAFVQAILSRLGHQSTHVQLLTLRLLETAIKNCGADLSLPRAVATKPLMAALSALAMNKRPPSRGLFAFRCGNSNLAAADLEDNRREDQHDVHSLARVLIRSWGEGFNAVQEEVPLFSATYLTLLKSGVGFPDLREEEKTVFKMNSPQEDEAAAIMERARLLREMIGQEDGSEGQAVRAQLVAELDRAKEDLQRRIPGLADEALLAISLQSLDQVENALQEYWTHVTAEQSTSAEATQAAADEASSSPQHGEADVQEDSELEQFAPKAPAEVIVYEHVESRNAEIADLLGLSSPRSAPTA